MSQYFPVVEIFGPTMQGEGAQAGALTHFIRFGGCDSRCVWCDSGYAVLPDQVRANSVRLTTSEILGAILSLGDTAATWVTLTGGNPALLQLGPVAAGLADMGFAVNVETQGTVFKDWMLDVDMLTLSPKGPSSGNVVDYATPEFATMVRQAEEVCLKVVVFDDADLNYAKAVHLRYPETNFYLQVGTYSGGLDGKAGQEDRVSILERWRELIEKVSGDPEWAFARVGVQQHALVWGHGRGF